MVLLGALTNRYLIVIPNLLHPFIPIQHAQPGFASYDPTLVEWTITAASLAGFVLLIILIFKPFPVITMWEILEEVEEYGEKEIGVEGLIVPETIEIIPTHATL